MCTKMLNSVLGQLGCPAPEAVRGRIRLRWVRPGQIVCLQSCEVTEMLLLVQGEFLIEALFPSGSSLIFSAENGISVMGDMELLSGRMRYASTVRARTEALLLALSIDDFRQWMAVEPVFRDMVVRSLAEKCYRQAQNQGVATCIPPIQRVARFLTEEAMRNPTPDGTVHCSHGELAKRTAMSVRTVNRVLSELRNLGAIQTEYGRLLLIPGKLQEIIAE